MGIARKGLQSIKTYAGGVAAATSSKSRSAVFLKMAMLEIERERKARERITSATRARQIEERITEIDKEVGSLQVLAGITEAARAGGLSAGGVAGRRRVLRF